MRQNELNTERWERKSNQIIVASETSERERENTRK